MKVYTTIKQGIGAGALAAACLASVSSISLSVARDPNDYLPQFDQRGGVLARDPGDSNFSPQESEHHGSIGMLVRDPTDYPPAVEPNRAELV